MPCATGPRPRGLHRPPLDRRVRRPDDPDLDRLNSLTPWDEPFGFVEVQTLENRDRQTFSLRDQRNLLFNIDAAEQQEPPLATVLHEGELINDDAYHGYGVVYDLVVPDGVLRVAQTTWVDPTTEHVYVLFMGCSPTCFEDNINALGDVVESYRVRAAQ